jgi:hypothetical protein
MEIKQAFQTIESELAKAKEVIEKKGEIEASLSQREDAVKTLEKRVEERAKQYTITPEEAEKRYAEAVKRNTEATVKEEAIAKREAEVTAREISAQNLMDNAQARMKDIAIEQEMIKERELKLIDGQRKLEEKIKQLEGLK